MFVGENDLSNGGFIDRAETSQTNEALEERTSFSAKNAEFLARSEEIRDGYLAKPSKIGNLGSEELTLSYLCENSKMGSPEKEFSGKNFLGSLEKSRENKGKDVVVEEEKWVERDFLRIGGSKREIENGELGFEKREKKLKIETLNLTGSSDDFPAPSLSYSYSLPFSHNPSCSLTRNSTEFEYSVGSYRRENHDQIWYCGGEGTNGSVHSRFKPVGDGGVGSENNSFFPSELPARPVQDNQSTGSRGRGSERQRAVENDSSGGRARKLTRPERLVREVVSESVPVMAQIFQELPDETIEITKEYLKNLLGGGAERSEELAKLQNWLERRSDLTFELLSKCNKVQLEILVAVKTGLLSYLPGKNNLSTTELVEVFLLLRCRNVNCKSVLPIDDCDCKICSTKKGFCSACMCPVCLNFDCASNTCSWVGCDVCSHWCHAVCGLQKNLIMPGPSLKGPAGTSEMQFHCLGCGHASEMFGFVKDVFMCCAEDWGLETLVKELDCVRKIFKCSEDSKGKELQIKAEEMLSKLENKIVSPSDACNAILQFLKHGKSDFSVSGNSSKDLGAAQVSQLGSVTSVPSGISLPPKSSITYNTSPSFGRRDMLPIKEDAHQNTIKAIMADRAAEEDLQYSMLTKSFENLESIIRIKEAEARMFQSKADEALREADGYRRLVHANSEKMEEEYTSKLAKLCLQETEERRRKKLEELKALESSHCDYYNMKFRMQTEIAASSRKDDAQADCDGKEKNEHSCSVKYESLRVDHACWDFQSYQTCLSSHNSQEKDYHFCKQCHDRNYGVAALGKQKEKAPDIHWRTKT
ncbi:hypothetical protein Sjap_014711 [Stephania japonica]|uniref:OBERON-like protein n=1 Tax=Stephania japonica TaxID=461633 RepID=A0AAP0NRR3_9MAGN